MDNGNFIVYNGTGNSVTVTGLTENTEYVFRVVEYNQSVNTGNNALLQLGSNAEVEVTTASLGLEDDILAQFTIYPNPVKEVLFVDAPSSVNNAKYEVYTLEGRILASGDLNLKNNKINVAHFSAGIYLIKITDGKTKSKVRKFLVQ